MLKERAKCIVLHFVHCPSGIGLWTVGDPLPWTGYALSLHQVLTICHFPCFPLKVIHPFESCHSKMMLSWVFSLREKDNIYPPFE